MTLNTTYIDSILVFAILVFVIRIDYHLKKNSKK